MKAYATKHDFPNLHTERSLLAQIGVDLVEIDAVEPDEIAAQAADAVALFVQYTPIVAQTLERLTECRVIVRYGIGFDNVDLEAAAKNNIPVCNVPHYCIDEVADHTFAMLLAAARQLIASDRSAHGGEWAFLHHRPIYSLAGRTLGLAGFGHIARQVAKRALAFGMDVAAHDPWAASEAMAANGVRAVSRDELFRTADFLSLHVPFNNETRHYVNEETLSQMKDGVIIVNTARGGLVKTEAAADALRSGRIGMLCLDVLETEPPQAGHPFVGHPRVILTPHSAYYSEESLPRLQRQAAEEAIRVLTGHEPQSVVNRKFFPQP